MDRYSLDGVCKLIESLTDKLGSDYFTPLIVYERFQTITYDFIRENTEFLEATQEISDDIKTLLVRKKASIVKDTAAMGNIWNIPEPTDYMRLVSVVPFFLDAITEKELTKSKKVSILTEGQNEAYSRDPYRQATAEYPNVFRLENLFKVDVGQDTTTYSGAFISYIKTPTFSDDGRIVNLPNIAIEKIVLKTADSLRFTSGDASAAQTYQFNSTFGKKGK